MADERVAAKGFVSLMDGVHEKEGGGFEPLMESAPPEFEREASPSRHAMGIAEEEVEKILREARKQAEEIEREAFEQGFAQGEKAGRETAERSLETAVRALQEAAAGLDGVAADRTRETGEEVVRLAMAVARKILQREVRADPKVVVDVVRSAVRRVNLGDEVTVRVHPMDLETVKEARSEVLQDLEGVFSLGIEADESVERGGAMVESAIGELDARLERQLEEIESAFDRILKEESNVTAAEVDS